MLTTLTFKEIPMTLYDCEQGKTYQILSLDTQDVMLKDRLISFGIVEDKTFYVVSQSISRLTIAIKINGVQIALRDDEAKEISVKEMVSHQALSSHIAQ